MLQNRRIGWAVVSCFLLAGLAVPAAGEQGPPQPFICENVTSPFFPVIRAEGRTELVGDIVLQCTGGIPTPAGNPVSTLNVSLALVEDAAVTSRLVVDPFREALLLIDEPNSPLHAPTHPLLNCGAPGASDSGGDAGICRIISTGDPGTTYDGTPNAFGSGAVCDGASGRPAANAYGCGRPNVFQARSGLPQSPTASNAIWFPSVPLSPPGNTIDPEDNVVRILRITNVRVDASAVELNEFGWTQIHATVSIANGALPIDNPQQVVANVAPGLRAAPGGTSPVRLLEGFAESWKTRNISLTVGDHAATPGNATLAGTYQYNGGTNDPDDVAQNVPGVVYRTESGFQWRNNLANAPPSPSPPAGFGVAPAPNTGGPLQSAASGGGDTMIDRAGVADAGTRVALKFSNVPAGSSVQVPPVLYLFPQGFTHNGNPDQYQAGASGVMVLTNTDASGAGPFSPSSGTLPPGNSLAVYEILYADPTVQEYADVPFSVGGGGLFLGATSPVRSAESGVQVSVGLAPFYEPGTAGQASGGYPIPRFVDRQAALPCAESPCEIAFPPPMLPPADDLVVCQANAGVPPIARHEATAEYVGDLVMVCTGGTPTPAGQPVPRINLTATFSAPLSSELVADDGFLETLLIVGEPNSTTNPARPLLNCGRSGAPDNGPDGPGVCRIVSAGDPTATYNGVANGYSGGACDGTSGRPAAGSFGCGRPNVFQGRAGMGSPITSVTFPNIPFDPPGLNGVRIFRITNARVNASFTALSTTFYVTQIQVEVSGTGEVPVQFNNPQQVIAYVLSGMSMRVGGSRLPLGVAVGSPVTLQEGFASAWRAKNFSFLSGNGGAPGNGTFSGVYYDYNGATNYPPDLAQNVPGAIYNTESGFQWQNNGANGPPAVNPPPGVGTTLVSNTTGPLASEGFGGQDTGIATAGVVDSGTRIAVRFQGIPPGTTVEVPTTVPIHLAQNQTVTGVMALTATDTAGAGPFNPRSGSFNMTDNLAVYEVLFANPFSLEQVEIPFTVSPPGAAVTAVASFAPFYPGVPSGQPDATLPEPRFADAPPCVYTVDPLNDGFLSSGGDGEITVTAFPSSCSWTATTSTPWITLQPQQTQDVQPYSVAANPDADPRFGSIQIAGTTVNVVQAGACQYSIDPTTPTFGAAGGSGSVAVTASSGCEWTAVSVAPWITINSGASGTGNGTVSYSVDQNSGAQRVGTVNIAASVMTVTQRQPLLAQIPLAAFRTSSGSVALTTFGSSALANAGGIVASSPAVAQYWGGPYFVAARDSSGAIWANFYIAPPNEQWGGWKSGGGVVIGEPAIADIGSDGWIAARDSYNSYWLLNYNLALGFGAWTHLSGVFATDPALAACPDGSLYIVGRDQFDALWSGRFVPGTGFQGFQLGGGVVQGKPSITCGSDNTLYIAARDHFNSTWIARVVGDTWAGWYNGGAVTAIDPKIAAVGNTIAVVILDETGAVWRSSFTQGSGNGWQGWTALGGILADIAPAGANGELFFAGRAPNSDLWWWRETGNAWTWIGYNGVVASPLSAAPR